MQDTQAPLVVIGASAGGVTALLQIARDLPTGFPAAVCIVLHTGANPSVLPELLRYHGANPAMRARDGQLLVPGTLYTAPPDHHLLVDGDRMYLSTGPRENHARPAIDPLFRTAAVSRGGRVIGVVLTGFLDDGTAGLDAVKRCGGTTVVQDPATAEASGMPASALRHVAVDHCVALEEIGALLHWLVTLHPPAGSQPPGPLEREALINRGARSMPHLTAIATPSELTCPDCGGGLWEVGGGDVPRYRCHTGHAFSPLSLLSAQTEQTEEKLMAGLRSLQERQMLLRRMAQAPQSDGSEAVQADRLDARIEAVRALVTAAPDEDAAAEPEASH